MTVEVEIVTAEATATANPVTVVTSMILPITTATASAAANPVSFYTETILGVPTASAVAVAQVLEPSVFEIDRDEDTMTLTIHTDVLTNQPSSLPVSVALGNPLANVYFFINSSNTVRKTATLNDLGSVTGVSVPVDGLPAGSHTLKVDTQIPPTASAATATFTTMTSAPIDPIATTPPTVPTQIVSPTKRWIFQDLRDLTDVYIFPINPSSFSQDFGAIPLQHEHTTAISGQVVSWEGTPKPPSWTFSGTVIEKDDLEALQYWANKEHRFFMTDHYGKRWLVKVTSLKLTPKRYSSLSVWHHDYEMAVTILGGDAIYGTAN